MMRCPACQSENRNDAQFCSACGASMGLVCPTCGNPVARESRFCNTCGAALPFEHGKASPMQISRAIQTPAHLAERILSTRAALEGERKHVTVLFADIVDSTRLVENLDSEEAAGLLEPCLDVMIDCVHCYEGTVTRVVGDGIVVLFALRWLRKITPSGPAMLLSRSKVQYTISPARHVFVPQCHCRSELDSTPARSSSRQ